MDFRPAMRSVTGIGRYARRLAAELAGQCELALYGYFRKGNVPEVRKPPAGASLHARPYPSRLMDLLARLRLVPTERLLGGCDLFHHTNFVMPVLRATTPQAMTLHDLAFLRDPACHTPRAVEALTRIVERAAKSCAAFLVPSEATARDCEEFLGLGRDRVFVTPLGVDPSFFELAPRPSARPYLLAVGTLEPRKNHRRLIRALDGIDADLRIVGKRGWLCADVLQAAGAAPNVHLEGHVDEERLRELLAGATAVAYPSTLEGFGLPVLEAMAAGKPVLTSDIEPLRAVAGEAALLVDPLDDRALADAVLRILFDEGLRAELAAAGPAQARRFTWQDCAQKTLQAYHAVLS